MYNLIIKFKNFLITYDFIKNTGVYAVTTIINSAIPFLLIPFLTNYLSPSDYGLISMHAVLLAFITPFIGYNTNNFIGRLFYSLSKNDLSEYIGNLVFILSFSILFISPIIYLFSDYIYNNTFLPEIWIWSAVLIAIQQFFVVIPLTLWQINNKATIFGIFQVSSTLLNFLLTIMLILYINPSWTSRIQAQLISGLITSILSIYYIYKLGYLKINFNKSLIISGLKYGIPLIPHAIGGVVLSITNRYFLVKYIGLNETGLFFLAFQITSIINILTSALNMAYVPWLYSKLTNNQSSEKLNIVKFTYKYFVFLILLSAIFLLGFPQIIFSFSDSNFHSAQKYLIWLTIGNVFNGMYLMVTNYIYFSQKTYLLAIITFISAFVSIICNYLLIPIYGGIGAGIASSVSFAVLFLLTFIVSNKVIPMPWLYFLKKKLIQ
jgi:O-antigen/teichoic acid export membrane protein